MFVYEEKQPMRLLSGMYEGEEGTIDDRRMTNASELVRAQQYHIRGSWYFIDEILPNVSDEAISANLARLVREIEPKQSILIASVQERINQAKDALFASDPVARGIALAKFVEWWNGTAFREYPYIWDAFQGCAFCLKGARWSYSD